MGKCDCDCDCDCDWASADCLSCAMPLGALARCWYAWARRLLQAVSVISFIVGLGRSLLGGVVGYLWCWARLKFIDIIRQVRFSMRSELGSVFLVLEYSFQI
jgi:hypothetical protein